MGAIGRRLLADGFGRPAGIVGEIGGRLMARGNAATERHVAELAAPRPGQTVLVLGPGPGVGVRVLLEAGAEVVALDPSPTMLAATLRRCRDLLDDGARLTLRAAGAEDAASSGTAVDTVISVNNVMLWPDRATGLAAARAALRPGGRLLLSVHQRWAPDDLVGEVGAAGFDDVEHWTWEPPSRRAGTAMQVSAVGEA